MNQYNEVFPDVVTAGAVYASAPASHPCANFGTDRRFTDSIWPGIQTAVIKSRNKEREYQERQRVSSLRIQEELLLRHAE